MFSWKTILSIGFAELLSHTNLQMYDDSSFAAVSTPSIMGLNNKKSVCQTNSSIQTKINGILTLSSFWHYQVDVVFRATYFINWMPSRVLIFKTPRELLSPPLSSEFFPHSSCALYVFHIHHLEGGLLDPRALKYIFLGYLATKDIVTIVILVSTLSPVLTFLVWTLLFKGRTLVKKSPILVFMCCIWLPLHPSTVNYVAPMRHEETPQQPLVVEQH